MSRDKIIGFIGQGWIGKNYADNFESRGFKVTRYSQEEPYIENKEKIKNCDIVFIAVPTPTTPNGFSDKVLRDVIKLVGNEKIAVIKSTVLPGTTESIQKENPNVFVLHSPEFLTESTARYDADYPKRNIVGLPVNNNLYQQKAKEVLAVLPEASYQKVCGAKEAELIKYSRNCLGFARVIFANLLYDLAQALGSNWEDVREAITADPDNGPTYLNPIHKSGRGAGGHCFIKDFEAFSRLYQDQVPDDKNGLAVLRANVEKNIELLKNTKKDLDLLAGVYGENIVD